MLNGTSQIFDGAPYNGCLLGGTPYNNYGVQFIANEPLVAGASYQLTLLFGFAAGLGGGTARYLVEFGTVDAAGTGFTMLTSAQNDPSRQTLFEILSGHGNSEEYRDWEAVRFGKDGKEKCPEMTDE